MTVDDSQKYFQTIQFETSPATLPTKMLMLPNKIMRHFRQILFNQKG